MTTALLLGLVCFLGYCDGKFLGVSMLDRPIIMGSLTGLVKMCIRDRSDRPRLFEPVPENAEHTLKLLERKHKLYNALVGGNVYGSFGERV